MSSATNYYTLPRISSVEVLSEDVLFVRDDGICEWVAIASFPRLAHATRHQLEHMKIGPRGVYWPDLDEDICLPSLAGVV